MSPILAADDEADDRPDGPVIDRPVHAGVLKHLEVLSPVEGDPASGLAVHVGDETGSSPDSTRERIPALRSAAFARAFSPERMRKYMHQQPPYAPLGPNRLLEIVPAVGSDGVDVDGWGGHEWIIDSRRPISAALDTHGLLPLTYEHHDARYRQPRTTSATHEWGGRACPSIAQRLNREAIRSPTAHQWWGDFISGDKRDGDQSRDHKRDGVRRGRAGPAAVQPPGGRAGLRHRAQRGRQEARARCSRTWRATT